MQLTGRYRIIEIIAVMLVYIASARLSQMAAIPPGNITPLWLPSGIMVAWTLWRGTYIWPGVFLGAFIGNSWVYFATEPTTLLFASLLAATANGVGDVLSTVIAAALIIHITRHRNPFKNTRDIGWFLLFAVLLGPLVSALFGVTFLAMGTFIDWHAYPFLLTTWWVGDAIGALILTPLCLTLATNLPRRRQYNIRELAIHLALVISVVTLLFITTHAGMGRNPFLYLLLPLLFWAALRLPAWYTFTLLGVIAVVTVVNAVMAGHLAEEMLVEGLILVNTYLAVMAFSTIYLSVSASEHRKMTNQLRIAHSRLKEKIALRTLSLQQERDERQRAEETVAAFFDQSVGLFLIANLNGTILRINRGWQQTLGYTQDDLEGRSFLTLVHPEDSDATLHEMAKLEQGENTFYFENRYLHKMGGYRLLSWSAIALPERHLLYASANDITKEREAMIRFVAERQRIATILDGLPNFVYLQRRDYTISYYNQRFFELFGDPANKPCYQVMAGRETPCEPCPTFKVFTTLKPVRWEWESPDGLNFQIYDYLMEDVDGTTAVLELGVDMTEQRMLELQQRQLQK
ncbi:MAG: MASE1 domain-containing protein, partial [Gammaproteobacteria bacterium]|nr:MASE1 domain-containing protein [Gammaproteobacteria bacterium]